jgi:SMI1/KNR4 family protein SUKH-1
MNWREEITGIYENRTQQPGIAGKPQFYPPASAGDIVHAEVRLNAMFPASIRALLLETNGVMDMLAIDGGEWFDSMWLLWTVTEILEQNLFYRAATEAGRYHRDFRPLIFFAGAGCDGILFGFPVMDDGVCAPRVMVWHPIMDELDEIAPSLEYFLRGWLTGAISV